MNRWPVVVRAAAPTLVLAVLLVGCGSDDASRASVASAKQLPRALVTIRAAASDVGPILGVAQDATALAWAGGNGPTDCWPVRVRHIASGRTAVVGAAGGVELCDEYGFWLAVGGTRALWAGWEPANHPLGTVQTGGIGRRPRTLQVLASDYGATGDVLVDVVGDGRTLAYATVSLVPNDWEACFPEDSAQLASCRFRVSAGAVKRVVGDKAIVVRGVPPSFAIAVGGGRLAVVPADLSWRRPEDALHARADGEVEIRDARTARVVTRVQPRGEVEAVALSARLLAVLVDERGQRRLETYDAPTGRRVASARVGSGVSQIAAADTAVVFAEQNAIRAIRAPNWTVELLAKPSNPFDLSIEGGRVIWGENRADGRLGRILAIELR